jgi:RNA polymerase sigma-70 factor (ECF subfamily)
MRAYQDMVFSTAARLVGQDAQAEDIAQEVFVRSYTHFDTLRDSATRGGWLKTVATNLAINHLQRHRRRWRLFSELAAEAPDGGGEEPAPPEPDAGPAGATGAAPEAPLAAIATQQQHAAIEQAMRSLPNDQRAALVLYHFEELSYPEIAQRLRVSLAKVKTDIRRARLALLPLLAARGIGRESVED